MTETESKYQKDIVYFKEVLDEGYKNSAYFLPSHLEELRNHILRVHMEFEVHMELLIKIVEMRPGKMTRAQEKIFESMTFDRKIQSVEKFAPIFPAEQARRINKIRNRLIHRRAPELIREWSNPQKMLLVYEDILVAYEALGEHGSYVAEEMPEWGYPDGTVYPRD